MATLKRNDPCPCGSGKKYKKCCLKKLETRSRFDQQDQRDYNELLPNLFDYSKKYDATLKPVYDAQTRAFSGLSIPDGNAFSQLLYHWMLLNWQADGKHTVIDQYVDEFENAYSQSFASFLKKWKDLEPRFFYVAHADAEYMALKDLWSGKTQTILKTPVADKIEAGEYVIGYLYPSPEGPALGSDAVDLPSKLGLAFYEEMKKAGAVKQKHFTKHFDHLLPLLAVLVQYGTTFKQEESYEEILELIQLDSRRSAIAGAVALRRYLAAKKPRMTKKEGFAAAVHYWAAQMLPDEEAQSQKAVAETYGVSSSAVSSKFKQMKELS
ncbi:SEC-C domain-containing protein [Alkalicoccus urumqiensis]|nr:SEC-C domain-containing protein [Alkalicoccus urumqiensis]